MDKRTRVLVILAGIVAGAFVLDKAVMALVVTPLQKINEDLAATEGQIRKANTALNTQETVTRNWNKIRDRLDQPHLPDVHTNFMTHLTEIFDKVGVVFDVSGTPQAVQQGDFKEYIFDTKFKLTWAQFVDLLVELHNSKEFLKPLKLTVSSQYEKEDRLDVDLRLSTIEYAPVPVKAGAK
ncbi:MAG TPA: hypothetical protein VNM14_21125 [Planctomycetota bacterium]|jgi:hypothetical protein|nr:hypothetical protein [Planctomycetota bacterium]